MGGLNEKKQRQLILAAFLSVVYRGDKRKCFALDLLF